MFKPENIIFLIGLGLMIIGMWGCAGAEVKPQKAPEAPRSKTVLTYYYEELYKECREKERYNEIYVPKLEAMVDVSWKRGCLVEGRDY